MEEENNKKIEKESMLNRKISRLEEEARFQREEFKGNLICGVFSGGIAAVAESSAYSVFSNTDKYGDEVIGLASLLIPLGLYFGVAATACTFGRISTYIYNRSELALRRYQLKYND